MNKISSEFTKLHPSDKSTWPESQKMVFFTHFQGEERPSLQIGQFIYTESNDVFIPVDVCCNDAVERKDFIEFEKIGHEFYWKYCGR